MRFALITLSIAVLASPAASAVDVRTKFDIQGNGIHRSLSQRGFSDENSVADGLLFFGSQISATGDSFEFEVRQEFRAIFGDSPSLPQGDLARLKIVSPPRLIQMDSLLVENRNLNLISDIERLRASLVLAEGEAWVGRRPISLGTLSFFKVWNKFTRPVSGLFGPTILYGSDGFGASLQAGDLNLRALSLYGPAAEEDAHLLEGVWFNPFAEVRVLGGRWWERTAVGVGLSKTVLDWMVRVESLYLGGSAGSETQIGVGIDGAMSSTLSLLVESYYQSIGEMDTSRYSISDPSRFTNLRARFYSFALFTWQVNALLRAGFGDLLNGVDGGQIISLRLNYSLSDSIEILSEFNLPIANDGGEFAKRTFVFNDGNYLGSGSQLSLGLKATF